MKIIKNLFSLISSHKKLFSVLVGTLLIALVVTITIIAKNDKSKPINFNKAVAEISVEKEAISTDLQYEIQDDEVIITGFLKELSDFTMLVIPDTIEDLPVTQISTNAFKDNAFLESLVIGNNITTIKASAFENCVKLKSIVFGRSVKTIDYCSFNGCLSIKIISLNEGLESIGEKCFVNTQLASVYIPSSVTLINNSFSKDVTIISAPNSYAKSWAIQNSYKYAES